MNVSSSAADAYGIHIENNPGSTVAFTLDGITTANISGFNNAYGIDLGLNNSVDLLSVTNSAWENSGDNDNGFVYGIRAVAGIQTNISTTSFDLGASDIYGIKLTSNQAISTISVKNNFLYTNNATYISILNNSPYTISCCNLINNVSSGEGIVSEFMNNNTTQSIPVYDFSNSPAISYTGLYTPLTQACE
jgi:hypothetical protein